MSISRLTPIFDEFKLPSFKPNIKDSFMTTYNFFAGPAILPSKVIRQSSEALLNFENMGLSIMEISHRSPQFMSVMKEAQSHVKELLALDDDYSVLFLTGGASTQFYMSALNYLPERGNASYIDTGAWSSKAIKEAAAIGKVQVIASSKDQNYSYIPVDYAIPSDTQYVHFTSNNTIYGTQFHQLPPTEAPLICDMSSDIFSKPINMMPYGMIYAGAQKNMGPAGVTLVVLNKNKFQKAERHIPTMLDYDTHIAKGSMFNTPPVLPIYVSMLTMRWIIAQGGLEAMEVRNSKKAQLLYDAIDNSRLFNAIVNKKDRSQMNVCFGIEDTALESSFLKACTSQRCIGIKGHRSVGGFRASIYNAMKMEGVEKLVDILSKFDREHGG